ncbi:MAG: SMC-Scp complex subunit ScpB [Bifidobacterium sp.]|nr:SMC-Scp complex subunit ScpB [Bifidobacterium sp.]
MAGAAAGASRDRNTPPARPEYVDFDVEDFPGGLRGCLEAILMVADQPQQSAVLARVLAVDETQVDKALRALCADYDGHRRTTGQDEAHDTGDACTASDGNGSAGVPRGFELRHTARGWQFANRLAYEPVVAAFVTDGQTARLSQAALEALAIIAYRQPVTRAQVAAIRGVNSDGVIRSLVVRGLIREEGVDTESRAALLVTSGLFLEHMGLDSLDQLPLLAPFMPSIGEMENTEMKNGGKIENAMERNNSERNNDTI